VPSRNDKSAPRSTANAITKDITARIIKMIRVVSLKASSHRRRKDFVSGLSNSFLPYLCDKDGRSVENG
jgi:hypothetical protein